MRGNSVREAWQRGWNVGCRRRAVRTL